jgi:uncharacterized protein
MEKSVKITLIISVAVLLIIGFIGIVIYSIANPAKDVISVGGTSTIKVTPDIVTVHFNIETNGSDAKTAKDANSLILEELVISLVKIGFNREDIKTESLNIYEWTEWNGRISVSKGYKASHQVTVVLDSSGSSLVADVIDSGVDAGALLSYINFELSDAKQSEYKALALKQAGEDARLKAVSIAEGLGLKIGSKPVSVSTSDYRYEPWLAYSSVGSVAKDSIAEEAVAAIDTIVPGEQTVYGNIQVSYKLY